MATVHLGGAGRNLGRAPAPGAAEKLHFRACALLKLGTPRASACAPFPKANFHLGPSQVHGSSSPRLCAGRPAFSASLGAFRQKPRQHSGAPALEIFVRQKLLGLQLPPYRGIKVAQDDVSCSPTQSYACSPTNITAIHSTYFSTRLRSRLLFNLVPGGFPRGYKRLRENRPQRKVLG